MSAERKESSMENNQMTERLKSAVRTESAPPELAVKIRQRLDDAQRRPASFWPRLWLPVGVAAAVFCGLGIAYQLGYMRVTAEQQEAFVSSMILKVSHSMRSGLADHLHCSYFGEVPKVTPPLEEAVETLPPAYKGLLEIVLQKAPGNYKLYSAHVCRSSGRRFLHFQLQDKSRLLSVIVTRKGKDESFVRDNLVPLMAASGVPVFTGHALRFQTAALESGAYMAFVISDLPVDQNTNIMLALAPRMAEFLAGLKS